MVHPSFDTGRFGVANWNCHLKNLWCFGINVDSGPSSFLSTICSFCTSMGGKMALLKTMSNCTNWIRYWISHPEPVCVLNYILKLRCENSPSEPSEQFIVMTFESRSKIVLLTNIWLYFANNQDNSPTNTNFPVST